MTEHGPDWGAVAAQAQTEQVEQAIRVMVRQTAAYYLGLRRAGVSCKAAIELTLGWQALMFERGRGDD
jgi:hypothetical protein